MWRRQTREGRTAAALLCPVKDPLKMLTMTLRDYFLPSQGYTVVTITFASGLARLRYNGRFSLAVLTAVGAATPLIATDTEQT